ncbi:uncharacterized protein KZ484_001652 [Pholidichthys leucotaenia]
MSHFEEDIRPDHKDWGTTEDGHKKDYKRAVNRLMEVIVEHCKKTSDLTKVAQCKQKDDETPGDYFHRLRKVFNGAAAMKCPTDYMTDKGAYDSFEKAEQHEEKYVSTGCPTTDLQSEEEDVRRKRRKRPNPVYMESDGEPESSSVKRKFAKPPTIHFPVLPESNQYPSVPTPDGSSASGVSCSEGVQSFDKLNNGCCGSYLAELESTDLCNDDFASNHHHHPQGYKVPAMQMAPDQLTSDHLAWVQLQKHHRENSMQWSPAKCCKTLLPTKTPRCLQSYS